MRLRTGFKLFDRVTGGIPRETSLLVSGPHSTGKTYFAGKMFASNVKRGVPALFVNLDRPEGKLVPFFMSMVGRKLLAESLENETARFFDMYEYNFEERDVSLSELYHQLSRELSDGGRVPRLLVVDSFNRIIHNYPLKDISRFVSRVFQEAKSKGASCVFVVRTGKGSPVLRSASDGELLFRRAEDKVIIKAGLPSSGNRIFMGEYDGRRLRLLDVIE